MAMGYSSPNPPVACTITDLNDNILSSAYTQKIGHNHAEKEAYKYLGDSFTLPHNVYVTLEPCSHFGKTPPCVDLILSKKPKKVYIGYLDPNPLVKKRDSIRILRENGIEVEINESIKNVSFDFLSGFINKIQHRTPIFFLKSAISKFGFYTDNNQKNIQFSNQESNNITQFVRQSVDAILVGPATTFIDSPSLNFRGLETKKYQKISPKDIYFQSLINIIKNETLVNKINLRNNQPYRVFFISEKYFPKEIFFEKQSQLDISKTLFILMDNLSDKLMNILMKFSKSTIYTFENLDKALNDLDLNFIMVEGGNLLYEYFFKKFKKEDKIIEIESMNPLRSGKKPYYLDQTNLFLKDEFIVDSDIWRLKGI